ncbi:MAG: beta-lactamase family protein [Actinomycetia bacterium]|nr:beta-lactamase family protein [Actinomycetes bacterium]
MSVLVDGQVVEGTAGVVNLRTGVEVTPDSLFMIQSITKMWTATLVMQLVDEGLCELDVPVREYLPEFRTADADASAEITVRHLLTHTGGFEGDIWAPTTSGDDALQRFVEDLVSHAAQHARPGTMWSYCSAGCGVLGRLVEVQRQMSYEAAVRRYLAEPLGIEEIAFCANEALGFRTAIGHAQTGPDQQLHPLKVWAVMPPSNPAAGNQLAMSARELIAFAQMHVSDGLAPDGTRLLSPQSARAMRVRQVDHPAAMGASAGHGLGWFLSGRPGVVEHGGDMIGVASLLRTLPEDGIAIAVLTNGGAAGSLMSDLVDPLLRELRADLAQSPTLPSPDPAARTSEPHRYVGRYETGVARHDVTVDADGRLWLTVSDRGDAVTLAERAGIPDESDRGELRQVDGDLFVRTDGTGTSRSLVEFLETDATSRARFLHTGRAAPRTA